jgi:hypothetical protein
MTKKLGEIEVDLRCVTPKLSNQLQPKFELHKNVDDYIEAHFGGVNARMCERWGIDVTVVSRWRKSGMMFVVKGGKHRRLNPLGEISIP